MSNARHGHEDDSLASCRIAYCASFAWPRSPRNLALDSTRLSVRIRSLGCTDRTTERTFIERLPAETSPRNTWCPGGNLASLKDSAPGVEMSLKFVRA